MYYTGPFSYSRRVRDERDYFFPNNSNCNATEINNDGYRRIITKVHFCGGRNGSQKNWPMGLALHQLVCSPVLALINGVSHRAQFSYLSTPP